MSRKTLYVYIVALVIIVLFFFFYTQGNIFSNKDEGGVVITAITDSDGDGIPDWQEEIVDTDPNDAQSFPYDRDIALIEDLSVDDLLYSGPGEFVEQIIQRIRSSENDELPLTEEENERFTQETVDYFVNQVKKRGLPIINVEINNNADKKQLQTQYILGTQDLVDLNTPLNMLIFSLLAKQQTSTQDVQRALRACEVAKRELPREMIQEAYDDYVFTLKNLLYLCEALNVARTNVDTVDYFYIMYLLQNTLSLEQYLNPGAESSEYLADRFMAVYEALE